LDHSEASHDPLCLASSTINISELILWRTAIKFLALWHFDLARLGSNGGRMLAALLIAPFSSGERDPILPHMAVLWSVVSDARLASTPLNSAFETIALNPFEDHYRDDSDTEGDEEDRPLGVCRPKDFSEPDNPGKHTYGDAESCCPTSFRTHGLRPPIDERRIENRCHFGM